MVMVLDIKKLIAKKQYVGRFAFDCAPPKDKLVLPLTEVEGDLKAEGEYEIYEDDCVGVTFTLRYKLKGQCSYCLEDAKEDITFVSEVLFVPDKDDGQLLLRRRKARSVCRRKRRFRVQPTQSSALQGLPRRIILLDKIREV